MLTEYLNILKIAKTTYISYYIVNKNNNTMKMFENMNQMNDKNIIGKFITWRGNSALNCTRKPHESRSDECDIGFPV